MATRLTHKHQKFDQAGKLIAETVEQEPLEQFRQREVSERLETAIAALSADITRIAEIPLSSADTLAKLRAIVGELGQMVRRNHIATRALCRASLARFDADDQE